MSLSQALNQFAQNLGRYPFSFMFDGVPYVAVDTSKTAERVRFDIAHEIGHLMMHEMVSEDVAIPSLSTFRPCDFRP